jgi:hypothetical protein
MALIEFGLSHEPAPVFLRRKSTFIIGVDLGQSSDPTAIAVLEHSVGVMDEGSPFERHSGLSKHLQSASEFLDVRHLERLPLGMSYPAQVQHVVDLLARPPLCGERKRPGAQLVIDESGVGRAVGDIFNDAGMEPIRVSITAGADATCVARDRFHVPKGTLISTVDAALHTGTLRFAATLTEAPALKDELLDFRRKLSDAGRATYAARTGKHDDLVLAVAIACWWAMRPPEPVASFGVWGNVSGGATYGF